MHMLDLRRLVAIKNTANAIRATLWQSDNDMQSAATLFEILLEQLEALPKDERDAIKKYIVKKYNKD